MRSIPIQARIFFRLLFQLLKLIAHCEDHKCHSCLSAVYIFDFLYIHIHIKLLFASVSSFAFKKRKCFCYSFYNLCILSLCMLALCQNKDYKGIEIKTTVHENDPANLLLFEAFYIRKYKPALNSREECSEFADLLF